ncbi:lipoyl(octanoyl) transferase LipB [Entomomonas sp. E2T0]|uniref:lipoyl(octanoyl) transferase LipB n=1 Tax=Entomomonas sp. E2T0 TaxID=2930213 RepID=UPI0022283E1C|nr:lipoyl(octanoyl) transferase LipB [Entomomonas sp. E2T0]UYZ84646.1 lipoyl(octanoyl) transferase LipB [Entomomonas sp. E2T0]
MSADSLIIRELGIQPYEAVWHSMQDFTNNRTEQTQDEVWLLQHEPVFTQGTAGKAEHLLMPGDIPVVQSDRGGQVTYHGPGQLIGYLMIDVKRHHLGPRTLVTAIENSLIDLLTSYGIKSYAKADAPGVYVDDAKIASLGLRIRRNASFHGFALNAQMNLEPFSRINPCGYAGMRMTQLSDFIGDVDFDDLIKRVIAQFVNKLAYSQVNYLSVKE